MFLAKSNPEETIQEHTDKLLEEYEILRETYGRKINIDWQALEWACLYHDLGKMNKKFQAKIRNKAIGGEEVPHGYLSTAFFNIDSLEEDYSQEEIFILISAVANHHHRKFDIEENEHLFYEEVEEMEESLESFSYDKLPHLELDDYSYEYILPQGLRNIEGEEDRYKYMLLKGFLNKIDYAASGDYRIEYPNNFLMEDMENVKKSWGPGAEFNELQEDMIKNQDENIIAVAETGYGKTEAGLLWIGDNKGFFILPLRAAINDIYRRIKKDIIQDKIEEKLGLLHSSSLNEYLSIFEGDKKQDIEIMDYNKRGRNMSLPLNISTLDQVFDFVYKFINFEEKLATMAYSKIVIDEIQMYGPDLIAYLIKGLEMISRVGGRFSIITATLPPFILDLLDRSQIDYKLLEKRYSRGIVRHSMELIKEEIRGDFIAGKYKENKVLVIVNTIRKAQELYDQLEALGLKASLNIFHSGFTRGDRAKKEEAIKKFAHKDNRDTGIWICTQVAESSLDIDFDILITELSEINGLFQRMGRCYRKRELEENKTNIYLFDGGDGLSSGIKYVVDEDIFLYSKKALRRIYGDKNTIRFTEEDKWKLIDEIYSLENISTTKYYKEIIRTMNYIDSLFYNEMDRREVSRRFRNINSIDVIPESLYKKEEEEIKDIIQRINKPYKNKTAEERVARARARIELDNYKLSIPYYYSNNKNLRIEKINAYEIINIYKGDYSSEFGIKHIRESLDKELETEAEEVYGDMII